MHENSLLEKIFLQLKLLSQIRWCLAFLLWTFLLQLLGTEHQIIQLFIGRLQSNIYYRSQRSCGQGNVFAPVCHSVHGGSVCLGACWDTTHTPPKEQTPPGADTPPHPRSRHPPPLPGADTPPPAYGQ